jgi:hypothetical protein
MSAGVILVNIIKHAQSIVLIFFTTMTGDTKLLAGIILGQLMINLFCYSLSEALTNP